MGVLEKGFLGLVGVASRFTIVVRIPSSHATISAAILIRGVRLLNCHDAERRESMTLEKLSDLFASLAPRICLFVAPPISR